MNLPHVIQELVEAQNNADASAFTATFSANAVVHDEGNTYKGREMIYTWIDKVNTQYKTKMKPVKYVEEDKTLHAVISGDFPGSPLVLRYHFEFMDNLIQLLKIYD